ncbi:MAG TPA: OpgC domain-containing protein [Terriglobales bacterium]|nr:OpgC domain-containing protein [Terriglobales bacterium]
MIRSQISKWQPPLSASGRRTTEGLPLRPNPGRSRRLPELDALRGLMLIGMALTHLPTRASYYSNQLLGFVSWAEGFVLVSALLSGRVYGALLRQKPFQVVREKLWHRCARLYGYHLALLGVAFTVVAAIAVHTREPALQGLLDFYLWHHALAAASAMLLLYCPPLLDILPMYIVFLFLTPLVLYVGQRRGWKFVLGPSAALWLASQFQAREMLYSFFAAHADFPIPLRHLGAFNLFAWQFLWIFGLWAGSGTATQSLDRFKSRFKSGWTIALSILVAATFFILRYQLIPYFVSHPVDQGNAWVLFDKWQLGVFRLLNFAALGVLFMAVRPYIARRLAWTPLVQLGKSSLEVFCFHILLVFGALSLVGDGTGAPWSYQLAIVIATLAGMYAVAYLRARPKNNFSLAPSMMALQTASSAAAVPGLAYRSKSRGHRF